MSKEDLEARALDVLALSREHIRSRTRSPDYFERGDRFSAGFLGRTLGVAPGYHRAVGTDAAVAIDSWYEHLVAGGQRAATILRQTTLRLQDMTDARHAASALPALEARLGTPSCSLLDAACGNLAAVTTLGHASLSRRASADAANEWLALWRDAVWNHNHQQELHCGLCTLPPLSATARLQVMETLGILPADLHPKGTTFSAGVLEYLAAFSESGAAAMALFGALPFAERLSGQDLAALIAFLKATPALPALICRILRLAQDVSFDPSEPVSTGVVGTAAARGVSIPDLVAAQLPKVEIDANLRREWDAYSPACRQQIEAILARLPEHGTLRGVLAEVTGAACSIADALTRSADDRERRSGVGGRVVEAGLEGT